MNGSLRVGSIDYINALPLNLPFRLGKMASHAEFVYGIPSQLNGLLREGELDAALTSSVEYLDGEYQLLPDFESADIKTS